MIQHLSETASELAGRIALAPRPGDVMRESRQRYGFTQEFLATHLGVRRESLSRIESGHSTPTLDVVSRFSRIMALAQHVRARAALDEAARRPLDMGRLIETGSGLDLDRDVVTAVGEAALKTYEAKREALLAGLRTGGGRS